MTEDNEALIRQAFAAFAGGDLDAVLELCAHDVLVVEPPDRPDSSTHHGREGVLAAFAGWVDLWDDYSAEIVRMAEVGDHMVVVTHQRGRGQGSGVEVDALNAFVFTIRDRKLAAWRMFSSEEEAMGAAARLG